MTVMWVVAGFNFYVLALQSKYFPGDFNHNTIAMFASDIPFTILGGFLSTILPARVVFALCLTMQSAAGTAIVLFIDQEDPSYIFLLLVVLARGANCALFISIYSVHPKMFPTLFGVTSIGICNFVSRSSVIFAPVVAEIAYPVPIIIFTTISLIALFCSFFMVEEEQE